METLIYMAIGFLVVVFVIRRFIAKSHTRQDVLLEKLRAARKENQSLVNRTRKLLEETDHE
ncbi:MAG: hypothetical protein CL600_09995 [Alteromonas sp.]|jgi:hypothetical protein|nr:hypothetical protein [Alteromonas sp.]